MKNTTIKQALRDSYLPKNMQVSALKQKKEAEAAAIDADNHIFALAGELAGKDEGLQDRDMPVVFFDCQSKRWDWTWGDDLSRLEGNFFVPYTFFF